MNQQLRDSEKKFSASQVLIFLATVFFAAETVPVEGFLSADLLAAVLSSAGFAWLWYHFSPIMAGLVLPVGYAASILLGNDLLPSFTVLLILPMGITHILFLRNKLTRTGSVLISASCLYILIAVLIAAVVIQKEGSITLSAVKNLFAPLTDVVKEEMNAFFNTEVAGQSVNLINGTSIDSLIDSFYLLLPGALIACLLALSVFSGWVLRFLCAITHKEIPEKPLWFLAEAPISAAILIVSIAISATAGSTPVHIAARNLMMPLFSYFFLVGIGRQVTVKLIDGQPTPRFTRMILLTVSLLFFFPLFFILAACFGVIDSIRSLFAKSDHQAEEP